MGVPSPSNGILEKIAVKEGDTVQVGALLGSVGESASKSETKIPEKKIHASKTRKTIY